MLKKPFHKLLFIIPLLGLVLSYTNGISTTIFELNKETRFVHSEKINLNTSSFVYEIKESNDFNNFYFEEAELEDDFELDWFNFTGYSQTFISSVTENQKLYNNTTFSLLQKSTPLYDLFCNWKHHLS